MKHLPENSKYLYFIKMNYKDQHLRETFISDLSKFFSIPYYIGSSTSFKSTNIGTLELGKILGVAEGGQALLTKKVHFHKNSSGASHDRDSSNFSIAF